MIRGCDGLDEVVNVVVAVGVNVAMVRFGCVCSHSFHYVVVNDAVDVGVDASVYVVDVMLMVTLAAWLPWLSRGAM